ncbi:MAG: hypothetical protein KJ704_07195, partial [Proteobacteria bacterium]|nr:hypothetical protein [Pseudomonadota bacterium]
GTIKNQAMFSTVRGFGNSWKGINFLTFGASYPMGPAGFTVFQRLHFVGCVVPPELRVSGGMICRVSDQAGWFVRGTLSPTASFRWFDESMGT